MNTRISLRIAALLTVALAATNVYADNFEELYSVGDAGRLHNAAGAFVSVLDEDGNRTGEHVFLLHGGNPPVLDAEPVSDVWILTDGYWQNFGDDTPAMAGHVLLPAADGRAWAVGAIGDNGWLQPLTTLTIFGVRRSDGRVDLTIESVHVPGAAPESCFGATAVTADGGRSIFYVAGDCLGNPLTPEPGELWEYRIEDNRWNRRADLPVDLSNHSVVSARDFLWVFGGTESGRLSGEVYRYDMLSDSWSQVGIEGDRPTPRRDHRAVAAGNKMLVFGGIEQSTFPETLDDVWQLDVDTLTWTQMSSLPTGLAGMTVGVIPRHMIASPLAEILIYGGVVDAWSFPLDLSNSTCIYTSDIRLGPVPATPPEDIVSDK